MAHFTLDDVAKLSAELTTAYNDAKSRYAEKHDVVWPRCYRFYKMLHDPSVLQGWREAVMAMGPQHPAKKAAAIFYPLAFTAVETLIPRFVGAVLSREPRVELADPDAVDEERLDLLKAYEKRVQAHLAYRIANDFRLRELSPLICRDACIYGTAILHVAWDYEVDFQRTYVPRKKETPVGEKWELVKEKEPKFRAGMSLKLISPYDFFPDPLADGINRTSYFPARYVMWRRLVPVKTLWEHIRATKKKRKWRVQNLKELQELAEAGNQPPRHFEVAAEATGESSPVPKDDVITVFECWTSPPDPAYIIAIGRHSPKVILVETEEQHPSIRAPIPFALVKPISIPREFYGQSIVDVLGPLNDMVNALVNLRVIGLSKSVAGFTGINKDMISAGADAVLRNPLRVYEFIPGGTGKPIEYTDIPDHTTGVQAQINDIVSHAQMAAGTPEPVLGAGGPETARGYGWAIEQSAQRFSLAAESIAAGLRDILEIAVAIDAQYMERGRFVTIEDKGKKYRLPLEPDMLAEPWRIIVDVDPIKTNPALQLQQWLNMLTVLLPLPDIHRHSLVRRTLELMGIKDPQEFLKEEASDPEHENALFLARGEYPPRHPGDNDAHHIEVHQRISDKAVQMGPAAVAAHAQHIIEHKLAMQPQAPPPMPQAPGAPVGATPEHGAPGMPVGEEVGIPTPEAAPEGASYGLPPE